MRVLAMASVRAAVVSDKLNVARVHVRSWQVAYRGLIPDDFLGQMRAEDRAARYTFGEVDETSPLTIVAADRDEIVGFATFGASRDEQSSNEGELFALYVDPDHWGRGVGRTLIVSARTRLRDMSFAKANLWVLEGNDRALRFYGIDGWSPDGLRREEVVWGVRVNEIRLGRQLI